jgi:hypothetical protein
MDTFYASPQRLSKDEIIQDIQVAAVHPVINVFWLSVNMTLGLFVINHHERRKVHAKETS